MSLQTIGYSKSLVSYQLLLYQLSFAYTTPFMYTGTTQINVYNNPASGTFTQIDIAHVWCHVLAWCGECWFTGACRSGPLITAPSRVPGPGRGHLTRSIAGHAVPDPRPPPPTLGTPVTRGPLVNLVCKRFNSPRLPRISSPLNISLAYLSPPR